MAGDLVKIAEGVGIGAGGVGHDVRLAGLFLQLIQPDGLPPDAGGRAGFEAHQRMPMRRSASDSPSAGRNPSGPEG